MRSAVLIVTLGALLGAVPPRAAAQQKAVSLAFDAGRVTLSAQNVPVDAILAEWARQGGATIVNGERVTGPPVTLELADVPERQALDIVLRSVAGYLLAPRRAGSPGASTFDRIVILPTSVAPRTPPPAAAAARPAARPPIAVRPPEPAPEPDGIPADDGNAEPQTIVSPPPGLPRMMPPATRLPQQPADTAGEPEQDENTAVVGSAPPTRTNPFGVPFGSSTTPGVIAPVPQPEQGSPNRVQ